MSQSGFTPILLYGSTTASNVPLAANLTTSASGIELAINAADGKLFYKDSGGVVQVLASKSTGTIGGSTTQVQYNNSGSLAGSANLTFNGTTLTANTLNLTNALGIAYGGTNATASPTAGAIAYGTGTAYAFTSAGTSNQVLISNGASAPSWSSVSSIGVTSFSAGTTGFTPNTATLGAVTLAGTLITSNGGTGLSSYTAGDLPYYASGTALSKLGIGTSNQVLTSSGTAPQWSSALTITGLTATGAITLNTTTNNQSYTTTGAGSITISSGTAGSINNMTIGGTTAAAGTFTSITNSGLTTGRVVYTTTGGLEASSANLLFNGTTLTANTIGAFTLSGTIAGGGNQINNVIIGASTPLAGAFTTLSASTSITNSALTSGRVVYSTTGGLETDSANLLFDGTTLTANNITSAASTNLLLKSAGTTAVTIDTSQNVTFVGTQTLSAGTANGVSYLNGSKVLTTGSALTFDGTKLLVSSSGEQLKLLSSGDFTTTGTGYIRWYDSVGAKGYIGYAGTANQFDLQTGIGMNLNFNATGGITTFAVSNSEQMRLNSTGLGIGTSSPTNQLHVVGSTTTQARIQMSGQADMRIISDTGYAALGLESNMPLLFRTNATERMRIDSSGRLILGGLTGYGGLSINSNVTGALSPGVHLWINTDSTSKKYISFEYNGNGGSGSIVPNGTTSVSYNTSSDYRLKENIQPMTGALAFVRKQRPVTYKWKADGSEGSGYIAHWMQEDGAGHCVTGEKDAVNAEGKPQYQGIDTSFMVGPLNAALKELADIVDAQAALITQLKTRLDAANL